MGEIAVRQAILHGLIAAVFVEAVLQVWDIRRASSRLAFWVLALAFPFVILPCFLLLAPWRVDDHFAAGWALFSSARWADVTVLGVRSDRLVLAILAAAGVALCLRDLIPLLRNVRPKSHRTSDLGPDVSTLVAVHSARLGITPPRVALVETEECLLLVRGVRRPELIVSAGVLRQLDARQTEAAIIHELAHVRFRDPLAGWLLMAARLLMFWNPGVQLVGRAIAQEMEHRADDVAAEGSSAQSLSSALHVLGKAHTIGGWVASAPRSLRAHSTTSVLSLRVGVTCVSLAGILFFVI